MHGEFLGIVTDAETGVNMGTILVALGQRVSWTGKQRAITCDLLDNKPSHRAMHKANNIDELVKGMWQSVTGLDCVEPVDVERMYNAIDSRVRGMPNDAAREMYLKWEAVKREERAEEEANDDDDYEVLVEPEDKIFLPDIYKLLDDPRNNFSVDEVQYDALRDVGIEVFKYCLEKRSKAMQMMTMKILDRIVKRNGDLYAGLSKKECAKVDRILEKFEHERVWAASSHYNFFVYEFQCTPRQFFDRQSEKKRASTKKRSGGVAIAV